MAVVDEKRRFVNGEPVVSGSDDGEEDVGCLAQLLEGGLCSHDLAYFVVEAVLVP